MSCIRKILAYVSIVLMLIMMTACAGNDMSETEGTEHNTENVGEDPLLTETKQISNKNSQVTNKTSVLAVPPYVENVNSLNDLNTNQELFNSEIKVVESDPKMMSFAQEVVDEYDLDLKVIPITNEGMVDELDNYINHHQQPILVTLPRSHPVIDELNLKVLSDPKNVNQMLN